MKTLGESYGFQNWHIVNFDYHWIVWKFGGMLGFRNNIMITMLNNDRPKKLKFKRISRKKKERRDMKKKQTNKEACLSCNLYESLLVCYKQRNKYCMIFKIWHTYRQWKTILLWVVCIPKTNSNTRSALKKLGNQLHQEYKHVLHELLIN